MDWGKFDQLLKKRETTMFYDMTDREIKAYQRRKAQHELECVERRKQFEAKWKAEDELFFLKHGITRDEVLYGKKPEVPPVVIPVADIVVVEAEIKPVVVEAVVVEAVLSPNEVVEIPVPPIDVVLVDNIQLEELTCPIVEEEVPKEEVVVDIHVVHDVDSHDMSVHTVTEPVVEEVEQSDRLSLSTCSSHISSPLQVHHDPTLDEHIGLLDTLSPALILHTDVLAFVDMDGKPKDIQAAHIYYDPFLVHFHPIDYVLADFFEVLVPWCTRILDTMISSTCFLVVRHYVGLLVYVRPRLLFDPGGFEDESFRTGRE